MLFQSGLCAISGYSGKASGRFSVGFCIDIQTVFGQFVGKELLSMRFKPFKSIVKVLSRVK